MSIKVMSEVWEHAPLVGTDLLLLMALADMANDERVCWPGMKNLAHKARVSIRQVSNILEDLQNQGIITISARFNEKGGNSSNLYRVNEVQLWDVLTAYEDANPDVTQYIPPMFDSTSPPISLSPVEVQTNPHSEPSIEKKTRKREKPSHSNSSKQTPKQVWLERLQPVEALAHAILPLLEDGYDPVMFKPHEYMTTVHLEKYIPALEELIDMGATPEEMRPEYKWLKKEYDENGWTVGLKTMVEKYRSFGKHKVKLQKHAEYLAQLAKDSENEVIIPPLMRFQNDKH